MPSKTKDNDRVWIGQVDGWARVELVESTRAKPADHSHLAAPHFNMFRFVERTGIVYWQDEWDGDLACIVATELARRGFVVKAHRPMLLYQGRPINNAALVEWDNVDDSGYRASHFGRRPIHVSVLQRTRWFMNTKHSLWD